MERDKAHRGHVSNIESGHANGMAITCEMQKDRNNVSPGAAISFSINNDAVQLNSRINPRMDSSDSDIYGLIEKSYPNNPIDINSDVDSHIVKLKNIRLKNPTRLIFAHININSIRNKFDMLSDLIVGKVDILMITETKLDSSFPDSQFLIKGYSTPYRLDRNCNGGGILIYIREDIPYKAVNNKLSIEGLFVEINLRKKKWLLYNPNKNLISNHLNELGRHLDLLCSSYDNFLLAGDFNVESDSTYMADFCDLYNLKSLIKEPTCFKSLCKPTCIDLILTNKKRSFQNSTTIETGLSDFHKMVITVMKSKFPKQSPNIIAYRDYKNFCNEKFRDEIISKLNEADLGDSDLEKFHETFLNTLNKHAPLKHKYVRANQAPYMNKNLHKAVMNRSRLRNKFLKTKSVADRKEYNKQRNLCVKLFRKEKHSYFNSLDSKNITDNKKFWKTVKPYFSDKSTSRDRITLIENDEILSSDKEISEQFIDFFADAVSKLEIPSTEHLEVNSEHINDPIMKAINKYKDHPSIIAINQNFNNCNSFSFNKVTTEIIGKEISKLDSTKATQDSDIPTKLIKDNCSDLFIDFFTNNFNDSLLKSQFPTQLKVANVTPIHKKGPRTTTGNYRPVSILPNMSKIYEKCIHEQLFSYFETILSKYQCGFRKGYSAQHCLIVMLEKWRTALDNNGTFGALLTDLSKAFDCLIHDLLIAKLHAYGIDNNSLRPCFHYTG